MQDMSSTIHKRSHGLIWIGMVSATNASCFAGRYYEEGFRGAVRENISRFVDELK